MAGSSPAMTDGVAFRFQTQVRVLATDFARDLSLVVPQKQREQGMPGVWLARSLVRRKESTRVSHHRFAETIRHSLRNGFTTYSALSPAIGLSCHRPRSDAKHHRQVDASVEASRPRGFVVREISTFVLCAIRGHRLPQPTSVTIAIRPSWWARDGRQDAFDLPDVTTEIACDRSTRRANQLARTKSVSSELLPRAVCITQIRLVDKPLGTLEVGLLRDQP